jgi:MoaD family protein
MKIHIPTPLRQYAGKQTAVEVAGATVADALANLVAQHGELRRHLFTDDGKLRAFVNVYRNDEDIRYLQKEQTPLKDGDTLSIVPSIAGGAAQSTIAKSGNRVIVRKPMLRL